MVWGGPASLKVDMAMIRRTREPGEHGFTEIDELRLMRLHTLPYLLR